MADVSNLLRRAREQCGLEIADISSRTKIKPQFLRAIEDGAWERLPGDFFTRAFLRAYAREVRLPPDEVVAEYDELLPEPVAEAEAVPSPAWERPRRSPVLKFSPRDGAQVLALAVVALFFILLIGRDPADNGDTGAVGTSGVAEAAAPAQTAPPEPASPPGKLTLDIRPTAVVWVAATADGERVLYRLVQPGEHLTFNAERELAFRIGNAAAFAYSINGIPGRPLGGPDEVREFQITPANYRTYGR